MRNLRKTPRRLFRRPPTMDDAFSEATAGEDTAGRSAMVLTVRVGDAVHVPLGYLTAECDMCRSPVWLNPDVARSAERRGMSVVAVCSRCVGPDR